MKGIDMDEEEWGEFYYEDDYYAHEDYDAAPWEDDCYEAED